MRPRRRFPPRTQPVRGWSEPSLAVRQGGRQRSIANMAEQASQRGLPTSATSLPIIAKVIAGQDLRRRRRKKMQAAAEKVLADSK